ncbi:hypothetical protein KUH32_11305 [Thalassococcus sp. CAU 1522]|uniref:Uncharacterized protein n=1 Tax=Thalassococcus arenae TaxID=2851652 RepID=A0ABS6N8N2_9RHOB|nr:hypothetical protein [Thalassococcus arenae]MBV2360366.1 hypothetical protein [Thalassococcus arenae]
MKPDNVGLKVTTLDALAYLVPGTLLLWVLVQVEAARVGFLPADWPVTALDSAAAVALIVVLGVAMQMLGHVFKPVYDRVYKPWRRRKGDPVKARFDDRIAAEGVAFPQPYTYAKSALANAERPVDRVLMLEGISKMFRAVALGGLVTTGLAAALEWWSIAALSIAVLLSAFWVHAHYRFEATQEVYQAYLQWRETPEKPVKR